jgi:hypothetical protein
MALEQRLAGNHDTMTSLRLRPSHIVAQTAQSAVSQVAKPAALGCSGARRLGSRRHSRFGNLRYVALATLAFLFTVQGSFADLTNLLSNGTFESGTLAGWNNTSGTSVTNGEAHGGTRSARFTSQSMEAVVSTTPGVAYKVTGWVKILSTTGNDADWGGFRLEAQNQSWQTLAHSGWLLLRTHGANWFKVGLSFTATSAQSRLQVGYFGGAGRQMVACADDLMCFAKPTTNTPPTLSATLTPTNFLTLPQTLAFSLTADDPDGAVRLVQWDFGDGARSQAAGGTRTVGVPGNFTASVRVADDEGAVTEQVLPWSASTPGAPAVFFALPAEGAVVATATAALAGSASGDGPAVIVTSDRGETASVSGTGNWTASIKLCPGWNRLLAQVRDASGRIATSERHVRLVPGEALAVADLVENPNIVPRWEILEANFTLAGSAATHPQLPFDTNPPPGLAWVDGVSVDGLFTPDNWRTVFRRPAFRQQRYQRALKNNEEWLHPLTNAPVWTLRFAPPALGLWKYRVEVREAKGTAVSPERSFQVVMQTNSLSHGPVRVARLDSRYFEHEDGTLFLGTGHGIGASAERYSFDVEQKFATYGDDNQQFFRFWIAGHLWGSAWQPWSSRTLGYNGTVPNTGLSLASAYADGLAALKLDAANPLAWQGFSSGHAAIVPGRTYRLRVRWRTEGVAGPATAGRQYGACMRWVGWPEPGQTHTTPLAIAHVAGDTPWHVAETNFVANGALLQGANYLANPAVVLENATAGQVFVDEVSVREVLTGGALGGELLRSPKFNSHLTFDQRRGAGLDAILAAAAQHGKYFKLVISEKQEELLNWLSASGLPDPLGGHFFRTGATPGHRLHEYYWRHLIARFGAFRSVHSWETVNEQDPNDAYSFTLTADLARAAAADGNPKLATTSTWATLATNTWNRTNLVAISYADFHAYVRGTGWIEPKDELANDSARFFHEYDLAARAGNYGKPVVWGEQGIDGAGSTDNQEPRLTNDVAGVWLHKLTWARTGPGGVYPLYWYTDNLERFALHGRFGAWNRFMAATPLHNGRYVYAAASSSHPGLRVLGQKDLAAGRAHLWLDNRAHTWRALVDGSNVPPLAATVQLNLGASNASFRAQWYDTTTGQPSFSESLVADAGGVVVLSVTNLATDTAVQLFATSGFTIRPEFLSAHLIPGGVHLVWRAEAGRTCQVQFKDDVSDPDWVNLSGQVVPAGLYGEATDASPMSPHSRLYRVVQLP